MSKRQKTYPTPEQQWDRSVAYYLRFEDDDCDAHLIGREWEEKRSPFSFTMCYHTNAQVGVVVQPHRFFKLHDLVVAQVVDGQAHNAVVWAVSSKGRRVKRFRLIWQRYRDGHASVMHYSKGPNGEPYGLYNHPADSNWRPNTEWGRTKRQRWRQEKDPRPWKDVKDRKPNTDHRDNIPLALCFEYPDDLRGLRVDDPAVRRFALALRARHADRRVGTCIPATLEK